MPITVHTSSSCYFVGFGGVYVSWVGWVGYEWSWNCHAPSQIPIPNPNQVNATALSSNQVACIVEYYSVIGQEHIGVQNSTTYSSFTVFTSSSLSTFTTTTANHQNASYVAATTISLPPSAWEIVTCTLR